MKTPGKIIPITNQKITPFLCFKDNAEEAASFYVSIFKNSKILQVTRYGEAGPAPAGTVMTITFQLDGQQFVGLNGPEFTFTPAISLFVSCENQQEVDAYWEKLVAGGKEVQCGWLEDKFGVSWQIVPEALLEMLGDSDSVKTQRVMRAMFKMIKLDLAELKKAYDGSPFAPFA